METLHEVLEEELRKIPEQFLGEFLANKLKSFGIELSSTELRKLRNHILNRETTAIHLRRWQWWKKQNVDVEFTEEDEEEFEQLYDEYLDRIPQIFEELAEDLSISILETLKKERQSELREHRREQSGFQRRLYQRWKTPLDLLRMLLIISQEYGESIMQDARMESGSSSYLIEVLARLQARACQVANEVLVLLEAGLADGAMARWRTLHEIAVIALFIGEHGEDIAERYVLHENVESRLAARDYMACQERLGYEPLEPSEVADIEKSFQDLIERFKRPFGTQYGWAAEQLGLKKPEFRDIEQAVGIDHLRAHYRLASHNVHANPKGVFFKFGLINEVDFLLAGPSNAGLADPGHSTAISLVQASTPLGLLNPTLDSIVALRIMLLLEDEIGKEFERVDQLLLDDYGSPDDVENSKPSSLAT